MANIGVFAVILIILLMYAASAFRIVREYERVVVYTLGRYTGMKGPGWFFIWPPFQAAVRVDLRVRTVDVPTQDVISQDNVSVKVDAVVYFRVVDPGNAINNVADFMRATSQLAQTTLRSVLGKHELDDMLAEREKLNKDIQSILDEQTDQWGIKVTNVEIKRVDLDESMIRAIAKQAEAERIRRAKIINAEGEQQAAAKLVEASKEMAQSESAMLLRYLATLQDISSDRTNTIVLPLPGDFLDALKKNIVKV